MSKLAEYGGKRDFEKTAEAGISHFNTGIRSGKTMEGIRAEGATNPFQKADVQLCRLENSLPKDGGWLFELKYDGYRILAFVEKGGARLLTRNGNDYTERFRPVAESLAAHAGRHAFVLDGEIVVTDKEGKTDFQALQGYIKNPKGKNLSYIIFDLLALDGKDLRDMSLTLRKQKLKELLRGAPKNLKFSEFTENFTAENLSALCGGRYEGLVAKRADSLYSGTRNGDWIKLKCAAGQEFVVGGYTLKNGRREGISSLLLGYYEKNALIYAGRAGTGFSEKTAKELREKFDKIQSTKPPFAPAPKKEKNEVIVWLKPEYAAEIRFAEWTEEGQLRHASFKGLRTDKENKEIVKEVKLTSPEKRMFSRPPVSKAEVVEYYKKVAGRMMPYIKNRVLSLVRCPGGVKNPCFFKKHPLSLAEGLKVVPVTGSKGKTEDYFCVTSLEGIFYEVQMNTLEFHVWGSRAEDLDRPDVMVFDLDPDEGMTLERVRQGVRDLKSVLDGLGLRSFLKTSGGKGYHVVVPFAPSADWEAFRAFSKKVAEFMANRWSERYTANVRKISRRGKIFIDWIRNGRGATSIAPYSVRAREGAKVSMPLSWEELAIVAPDGINMEEAVKRLSAPDPWIDFFEVMKNQKLK